MSDLTDKLQTSKKESLFHNKTYVIAAVAGLGIGLGQAFFPGNHTVAQINASDLSGPLLAGSTLGVLVYGLEEDPEVSMKATSSMVCGAYTGLAAGRILQNYFLR